MDNNIDKWGSLSMPERASLISLFTGSGVTSLDEMRALYNEYGNGGGIHIDPSKKGTFTSAAKRHGMGVQEFASRVLSNKDDYSTAMVRKANFARNAAKWHGDGGDLDDNDPKDPYNSRDGWFRYWYENRPYQIIDAINWQLDGTKSIEKAKKAIYDAINSYNETYIPTTINGKAYSGKMPSGVTNYWNRDNGLSRYVIGTSHYGYSDNPERDFVNNSYGLNDPEFRQIIYTQDPYNGILKRTLIHERSHAIPWFIKDRVSDKRLLNDGVDYDKYLDNINEIYSRLNEFRFKNNLDPRKTYTEDDIIKWRESGALKNFDLDRYDNDSVYNLINNVASNNVADNLPKNANYAAYGDDLRDTVYVPTDFSEAVDPSGTPEYKAELIGRPYISLDIDKYNRRKIKRMAQNAASGDEAAMYFNGDDRGTIMPSSDNKWRQRVFKRAFYKQADRNRRRFDSVEAKADAIERIKKGDVSGMYDYVNLGREEALRKQVLPFMGAALSPIMLAEAIPFTLNAAPGNVVAKGLDAFKYTMPGTYLKMAGMNTLGTYADAAAMAGYGGMGLFNFYNNPGLTSAAEAALAIPVNPAGVQLGNKLNYGERVAAKISRLNRMKTGNRFQEYISDKFLSGNKWLKYVFPKTISDQMLEKSEKMADIVLKRRTYQKEHFPITKDDYTFSDSALSNSTGINKTKEVISDPSLSGRAIVNKIVYSNDSYTVYHRPSEGQFTKTTYTVKKSPSGLRRNATSYLIESVDDNTLSPAIRARNSRINSLMQGDGVITGSPTLYEDIPGIPNDTDIITTEARANNVIKKLGLKQTGSINALGDKKYSFSNNSELYGTDPIDLDIIHETNGHASGKLAEEIYSIIDPVAYADMRNDNTFFYLTNKPLKQIPYSAEDLYSKIQKNPELIQELNMMNTFRSGKIKHNNRIATFISVDPVKSRNIIIKLGKSIFGKNYKGVKELMPKMNFDNIDENRKFLESLNMPTDWSNDPQKVSAVLEKYVLEKTTATRGVSNARTFREALDYAVSPSAMQSASGPGRNSVEGSKRGGGRDFAGTMLTALQFPISKKQLDFASPMDVVKAIDRQSTVVSGSRKVSELFSPSEIKQLNSILGKGNEVSPNMTYEQMIDRITFHQSNVGNFSNGRFDYSQQVADNEFISDLLDLPVVRTGSYSHIDNTGVEMAGYVGGLTANHYGLAYVTPNENIEIGSMFPTVNEGTRLGIMNSYSGSVNEVLKHTEDQDKDIVNKLIKQINNRLKMVSQLRLDSNELNAIKESAGEDRSTAVFKKNIERQRQFKRYNSRLAARRNEYTNISKDGKYISRIDYYGDILNSYNKYEAIRDIYRNNFRNVDRIRSARDLSAMITVGSAPIVGGIAYAITKNKEKQESPVKNYRKMSENPEELQKQMIHDMKNNIGMFKDIVVNSPESAYITMEAYFGKRFLKRKGITKESVKRLYNND